MKPLLLLLLVLTTAGAAADSGTGTTMTIDAIDSRPVDELMLALGTASFRDKETLVTQLAASGDARVPVLLQALLDGTLYSDATTGALIATPADAAPIPLAGATRTDTSTAAPRADDLRKITVNNGLRSQLRVLIAATQLQNPDPAVRRQAARTLTGNAQTTLLPLLDRALAAETDAGARAALATAQASLNLANPDPAIRAAAVAALAETSDKAILTLLEQQSGTETDRTVKAGLARAITDLRGREQRFAFVGDLFFGLSLGSVLLLAAVGLAITFGVMGVINMAHGEMIMLGAYTTYVVQLLMPSHIEYSLAVAVPAAFVVTALVGIAIERSVIRFLYGRPLETLLATFGISLVLQQLVRTIFSPLNKSVITPQWLSGSWEVNGMLSLTYNRLYIILFALAVLASLITLLRKTPIGLQMRAVTQNRAMASSMGIRTGWVDALTFGLGSGIAGIAGVALSQLTNVGPNLGQSYIIDSFLVVVFGGVGNLLGTFVAAMSLGVVNKFAEPLVGAVLAKILILVFVILFIQRRPRGLFALKGRFVED
ncbi:MAG: urea ABC transporter permease subunit UrtB [Porticoccaceae bacterium]|nr:MAG: urea ABC transporter permease subunit UrtB [Porticoccaceae bacterium]